MLGKLGGIILACMNATFARCVIRLLDLQPRDKVLEVGPDVAIQLPAELGPGRRVAGERVARTLSRNTALPGPSRTLQSRTKVSSRRAVALAYREFVAAMLC
jgi:hypothetical protein